MEAWLVSFAGDPNVELLGRPEHFASQHMRRPETRIVDLRQVVFLDRQTRDRRNKCKGSVEYEHGAKRDSPRGDSSVSQFRLQRANDRSGVPNFSNEL